MSRTAASYETYAEYVAARRATRHHVLPETLWTALKEDESLCKVPTPARLAGLTKKL